MNRTLLLMLLVINCFNLVALDVELDAYVKATHDCGLVFFLNNQEILVEDRGLVHMYNLIDKEYRLILNLNKSIDASRELLLRNFSRSKKTGDILLTFFRYVEFQNVYYYFKYDGIDFNEIEKSEFDLMRIPDNIARDTHGTPTWRFDLLGGYSIKIEGTDFDILPYITNTDQSVKKYFEIDDNEFNDRFYKPLDESKGLVTISPDKFNIAFWGWTTENIDKGRFIGERVGLFTFRITYDGIINKDTDIYNVVEKGLLKKDSISRTTIVDITGIKTFEGREYYFISYAENQTGWLLAEDLNIGSSTLIDEITTVTPTETKDFKEDLKAETEEEKTIRLENETIEKEILKSREIGLKKDKRRNQILYSLCILVVIIFIIILIKRVVKKEE